MHTHNIPICSHIVRDYMQRSGHCWPLWPCIDLLAVLAVVIPVVVVAVSQVYK